MFILNGHPQGLNLTCLAFAPRGQSLLASGGPDGIKLWDLRSRAVVRVLDTGRKGAASLAFSPDGDRIVAPVGEGPSRIRTWEVSSGRLLQELHGGAMTLCAVLSPDGKELAGCGYTYRDRGGRAYPVRRWNVSAGRERPPLWEHDAPIGGLAYSPDGWFLATASADHTAGLCDLRSRPRQTTRLAHRSFVWGVAFSPASRTLATAGGRTVRLFDTAPVRTRTLLRGHTDFVYGLAFRRTGAPWRRSAATRRPASGTRPPAARRRSSTGAWAGCTASASPRTA